MAIQEIPNEDTQTGESCFLVYLFAFSLLKICFLNHIHHDSHQKSHVTAPWTPGA